MLRRALPITVLVIAVAALAAAAGPAPASHGVVNVNTATVDQLQLLPRVGPALAARIVEFRKANGAFKTVDELVAVRGIGERSLELMQPYIAVKGDTTLTDKVRGARRAADHS